MVALKTWWKDNAPKGSAISFHLRARGRQLKISNIIAIKISGKLTFEILNTKFSKLSPENAKYNPKQLKIIAIKSLICLFN